MNDTQNPDDKKPETSSEETSEAKEPATPHKEVEATKAKEPEAPQAKPESEFSWAHAFAIVGTLMILLVALLTFVVMNKRGDTSDTGLPIEELNRQAHAYLAEQGIAGSLVLATHEDMARFYKIPENAISSGWISPDVAPEQIEVPVVYEFGVPAEAEWKLELEGNVCLLKAPRLQLIKILSGSDAENYHSEAATVPRPSETDPLIALIMPQLEARSLLLLDGEEGSNLRALARDKLGAILQEWLLDIGAFRNPEFATVKVIIAEPEEAEEVIEKNEATDAADNAEAITDETEETTEPEEDKKVETTSELLESLLEPASRELDKEGGVLR